MNAYGTDGKFENITQRVASTYCRMLTDFHLVLPEGITPEQQAELTASQADLHAFFQALYEAIFTSPASFGLPVTEDVYILVDHAKDGPDKTDIKKILDRPRKLIGDGLAFLSSTALGGRLVEETLVLPVDSAEAAEAKAFLKKKPGKAWLAGLSTLGLTFSETGLGWVLASTRFPRMMLALQALAEACAACEDAGLGSVFFARCDFRALRQDFSVEPLDLYRTFTPEDYAWAAEMHQYFTELGYQPQVGLGRLFNWEIKYQGKKSIKATPLFQIYYDERFVQGMRAGIKCASSGRVVPLLAQYSPALQEDFAHRAITCANCHWCDNSKVLGPTEYEYQGEKRSICWYVPSDLKVFNEESARLVKEYAQLHETLA